MAAEQQREDSSKERHQTSLIAGVWLATAAHWPEGMPFFGAGTLDPPGSSHDRWSLALSQRGCRSSALQQLDALRPRYTIQYTDPF